MALAGSFHARTRVVGQTALTAIVTARRTHARSKANARRLATTGPEAHAMCSAAAEIVTRSANLQVPITGVYTAIGAYARKEIARLTAADLMADATRVWTMGAAQR
mmetsp:Transcript_32989/g.57379  ORF Transcript_32989/g.57379 Transcript_32989/m.57379 type:complete len:106 (+) Transcript_32989:293-610(+)